MPTARTTGKGIGSAPLIALLAQATNDGQRRVSLSVEVDNPARGLYQRLGFGPVRRTSGSWTMLAAMTSKNGRASRSGTHRTHGRILRLRRSRPLVDL